MRIYSWGMHCGISMDVFGEMEKQVGTWIHIPPHRIWAHLPMILATPQDPEPSPQDPSVVGGASAHAFSLERGVDSGLVGLSRGC